MPPIPPGPPAGGSLKGSWERRTGYSDFGVSFVGALMRDPGGPDRGAEERPALNPRPGWTTGPRGPSESERVKDTPPARKPHGGGP